MSYRARAAAVLYVKNIDRVRAFYASVVGLELAHVDEAYVVLESPTFQLVILAIPNRIAASIDIADPPRRREETAVKLIFFVPSVARARRKAAQFGGTLDSPTREWRFQG